MRLGGGTQQTLSLENTKHKAINMALEFLNCHTKAKRK
jgi:hypothetical protein